MTLSGFLTAAYAQDIDVRDVDSYWSVDCDRRGGRGCAPAGPCSRGPVLSSRSSNSASTEAGSEVASPFFCSIARINTGTRNRSLNRDCVCGSAQVATGPYLYFENHKKKSVNLEGDDVGLWDFDKGTSFVP